MRPLLLTCLLSLAIGGANLADASEQEDRVAIEQRIESYVAAFNQRNSKLLAEHWSPEGIYISQLDGSSVSGREALEQEFAAQFAEAENARLEVTTESIDFVSPNVAIETGAALVAHGEAEPQQSRYRVVHIKRDGNWLVDRITEEHEVPPPPSHYEQLKDLEWMIGGWIDQAGGDVIRTQCQWTRNRNYLLRAFTASVDDRVNLSGMQFIGWDPIGKQIRSWVFDSDGGFAEGVWQHKGDRWLVQTNATLADGATASSTSVLRPIDKDSFTWQKVNRIVEGEILPNIDEVVIVRE